MANSPTSVCGSDFAGQTTETSPQRPSRMQRKGNKHVTRACNLCRHKKTKCNGERPKCSSCLASNNDCEYDAAEDRRRPISKAYVVALKNRVTFLERSLADRDRASVEHPARTDLDADAQQEEGDHSPGWEEDTSSGEPAERLQIDNVTGEVQDYGPTSMFKHVPPTTGSLESMDHQHSTPAETLASISSPGTALNESEHTAALSLFFSFFNPWCMWVDEQRFRQDMHLKRDMSGSIVNRGCRTAFYSPLLHLSILAIGVMYMQDSTYLEKKTLADALGREAATFFEEEVEASKLSAVSGLMLLGSHHAGHARPSLGYIYAGTGLRLSRILGIGIDMSFWVDRGLMTDNMKRIRDRVWHCAYLQDKLWSTYVGRPASPSLSRYRMPFFEVNDSEDAIEWCGCEEMGQGFPRKSWMSSTMAWTSKLAKLVDMILENVDPSQNPALRSRASTARHEICTALDKWHAELPGPLRVDSTASEDEIIKDALVPHVLTMNMMYHFTDILLNRADKKWGPRDERGEADNRCLQAADKLMKIADLYDQAFGLRFAPVSMTQFIFTAGTIYLHSEPHTERTTDKFVLGSACVKALHSIGQTWKSASLSGDILQKLFHDACHKGAEAPVGTREGPGDVSASAVNVSQLLRQDPDIAMQLKRLGWVPPEGSDGPKSHPVIPQGAELDTSMGPDSAGDLEDGTTTAQQVPLTEPWANNMPWGGSPQAWNDFSMSPALFDIVLASDCTEPQAWTAPFGLDPPGSWNPSELGNGDSNLRHPRFSEF